MLLTTVGKPKNVPIRLCKQAIHWYGKNLLGSRLYHLIEINVEFNARELDKHVYAYCEWMDSNHKAREFNIIINPHLNKKTTLVVLAHEMIHVKQYAKGELKDYLRMDSVKWKGKIYVDEIDYWKQPWEMEAHKMESRLYLEFKESLRKNH